MRALISGLTIIVFTAMVSSCDGLSSSPGEQEWRGSLTVKVKVAPPSNPNKSIAIAPITVLTVSEDEKYALLVHPDATVAGDVPEETSGFVVQFDRQYLVRGKLVTDPKELEVAAKSGLDQIILASHLELLEQDVSK